MTVNAQQPDVMTALAQALAPVIAKQMGVQLKHTTPTGTPSLPYYTGPGGLMAYPGIEREVISTVMAPVGIGDILPVHMANIVYPLVAYLLNFAATSGSNASTVCGDGPTAGPASVCRQTSLFGRYTMMTRELERNRLGAQIDQAEPTGLRLVNNPLLNMVQALFPASAQGDVNFANEIVMRMLEVGVALRNTLAQQTYIGNPANNTAGYQEFAGLDLLIGTGKVDAITNTSCPDLNSDIKNFNLGLITSLSSGVDIVASVVAIVHYIQTRAQQTGWNGLDLAIAMRPELFYEVSALWPCSYLTSGCAFRATDGTVQMNVDAGDQIAMRDAMRQGSYLLVDGQQVRVVQDTTIHEYTNATLAGVGAGQYASDIYFVPLRANGFDLTYWEFFDFRNGAMDKPDGDPRMDFWTDGGQYLWHHKPPLNWCEQWIVKTHPRLRLLTPHLAGRLQNVRYQPMQHVPTPFPGDPYGPNTGVTSNAGPSYYGDGAAWTPVL